MVQYIHNCVSNQVKTTKGSVLVWYFLLQSPGDSRLPGQPSTIVVFPVAVATRWFPFGLCAQVHLLRPSYYHGSFVTLEKLEQLEYISSACCETSYVPDPQEIHEAQQQREEPRSDIKMKTSCVNICSLSRLCFVRDYAFRTGFCRCLCTFWYQTYFLSLEIMTPRSHAAF